MPGSTPEFLSNDGLGLLVFGGKGGVGKTTCAASAALRIARTRPRARVQLMSSDPAHSVADCIGSGPLPPNLMVLELSAEAEHRAFMSRHGAELKAIASRGTFLDGEDIDRFVELSLPGVDELMAFLRVAGSVRAGEFDTIVVDSAPSGHTLRLLAMSDLLEDWLGALEALMAKHRYMAGLFARGAARAADAAEAFLEEMSSRIGGLRELLEDGSRCRFVPVMLAEPMSVDETLDVLGQLGELGVAAPEIVVNRLIDPALGGAMSAQAWAQRRVLSSLPSELASRRLWSAALRESEPIGAAELEAFAAGLERLDAAAWRGGAGAMGAVAGLAPAASVEGTAALPPRGVSTGLVFFAGKGGVGKTTLSAATALRLAMDGRRTLVVSTDPAHSLADCLGVRLRAEPMELRPGLEAMEVDAAAEYEALRATYREELEDVLDSMFRSVDASLDREAMERLLDLAPPGLDECMALLRIMEQLERRGPDGRPWYDSIVVDTAPTGHMLRLLELPEVIQQWLHSLFGVFIKYDKVFRLPKLQGRLVEISRGLKRLRAMLVDRSRCGVRVVSILTAMAHAECEDLVAALGRMGVGVETIFLNLATAPGSGGAEAGLAAALRRREAAVLARYEASFAAIPRVVVHRAGDPRGLEGLTPLAQGLYGRTEARWRAA